MELNSNVTKFRNVVNRRGKKPVPIREENIQY
jgi:hypothetical protein